MFGFYQNIDNKTNVIDLCSVEMQDLLGRKEQEINLDGIISYIKGSVILITGGGGSIGSELCRQVAIYNPKMLMILDVYENNAYEIEQELKHFYPQLNILVLIASIRDVNKMEDIFDKYRPEIVFNAAAHKHVTLMEISPGEAVKNNVFGALNVANCAEKFRSKVFVQISTDKAVNPTSIMGATKRIFEKIIQIMGDRCKYTKFVAVRFGNVFGSNGSVVPMFKKQIARGGPVTVTHRDITRYFMTISEATSLVLQAGAYAKEGRIFVLNMGNPVKIYDLAYKLIQLSGLKPDIDIEIKCIGLRPGEKLHEELFADGEKIQKKLNDSIFMIYPAKINKECFLSILEQLKFAVEKEKKNIKDMVMSLAAT